MNNSHQNLIKSGYLKKQSGFVKSWTERWFILKGKSLQYFAKEDSHRLQGTIELDHCRVAEISFNRDEPDKWLLEITQGRNRAQEAVVLWADSEALRTEWISALRRALYGHIGGGIFGRPLLETMKYDKENHGCDIPHLVKGCAEIILENGKEVEGIFRLSGRLGLVKELRQRYDEGDRPNLSKECVDVHTAASLLKLYFRHLPDPVIPFVHFESFLNLATSFRYNSNKMQTLSNLKALLKKIPQENYRLLDYLTHFLSEISRYEKTNKMTKKNIAIIFGTNILRDVDNTPEFEMATQNLTTNVVLALVEWHDFIFSDTSEDVIDPSIDEKIEEIVNISEEPDSDSPAILTSSTISAMKDLDGIDFTQSDTSVEKSCVAPSIPARAKDLKINGDKISNDSRLLADISSSLTTAHEGNSSESTLRPTPTPRMLEKPIVRTRASSTKSKMRPTAFLQEDSEPSKPNRKSDSLPITKVEREQSNFTSFIDSPLDSRVSLNIGDLPHSVEDLHALVLSLKIELKQLRASTSRLKQDKDHLTITHMCEVQRLEDMIHQERQTKNEAVAKVVKLSNQLALYQSTYGLLEDK
ncbi:rho GTPase-activating protein 24-like [Watersipora subatra]|uniref:rho GTPase-activating protein 24-like n=1 Tax=Watersipora subatra TaxID=2589382 RepID=UPI00355B086D